MAPSKLYEVTPEVRTTKRTGGHAKATAGLLKEALARRVNQLRRYAVRYLSAVGAESIASRRREFVPSQRYSVIRLSASCCMREMQTPGWLPVIVQDIDLAARLRSNGQSRTRRIPGMAARQIRQRCSRDSKVTDHASPQNLDSLTDCLNSPIVCAIHLMY